MLSESIHLPKSIKDAENRFLVVLKEQLLKIIKEVNGKLSLSGGTISGNLAFQGINNHIDYTGSKATYSMIRFLDNTGDTYGNGISIGGGGATVVGGGESASVMQSAVVSNGGSELLVLCNDGNVDVYTNCQNGSGSAVHYTFGSNGVLTLPKASQVSSDRRVKQDISKIPDKVVDAWGNVDWNLFKYKSDVGDGGIDNPCYHVGLIAQDVKSVGDSDNIDFCKHGILSYNKELDLWSVSYIEALALEAAYQRKRADELEKRIQKLEQGQ